MLQAIDPSAPVDFRLPGDDESPTVFKLRPLSGRQKLRVWALGRLEGGVMRFSNDAMELALKFCLVGWDNFGAEFAGDFDKDIDRLDELTIATLFNQVVRISTLSNTVKKKSAIPSESSSPATG